MLETERAHEAENHTKSHRDGERKQEDSDAMEERGQVDVFSVELRQGSRLKLSVRVTGKRMSSSVLLTRT